MNDDRESHPDVSAQAEAQVRDQLRALPRPQIPGDVSARVMAAITREEQARSSSDVAARPSRWRRLVPVAAAAAVALIALVTVPTLMSQSEPEPVAAPADCAVGVRTGADLSTVMQASGSGYSQANLANRAADVARQPGLACTTSQPAARYSTDDEAPVRPDSGVVPEQSTAATAQPDGRRAALKAALASMFPTGDADQQMQACVLHTVHGRTVELIDMADYGGRAAVILVVSDPREAIAINCQGDTADVVDRQPMGDR